MNYNPVRHPLFKCWSKVLDRWTSYTHSANEQGVFWKNKLVFRGRCSQFSV